MNGSLLLDFLNSHSIEDGSIAEETIKSHLMADSIIMEEEKKSLEESFIQQTMKITNYYHQFMKKGGDILINPRDRIFYARFKSSYLQSAKDGEIVRVIHWCIFSNAIKKSTSKHAKEDLKVKVMIPEKCENIFVSEHEREKFALIPPYSYFKILTKGKDKAVITVCQNNRKYKRALKRKKGCSELFYSP
jgi:hypothetical protein